MLTVFINVPGRDVIISEDPLSFDRQVKIIINSMEVLDNIIEQCRDIKLKLIEEKEE